MSNVTELIEEHRVEHFTSREVYLIKSALMREITNLNSRQVTARTKYERAEFKKLKLETFAVYQRL